MAYKTSSGGAHAAPTRAAIVAGLHVLVEKPLTADPATAAELVRLARASGLVCATVSQRRFEAAHRYLHDQLRAGAFLARFGDDAERPAVDVPGRQDRQCDQREAGQTD